jgi:hypothetical protein
MDFVGLTEPVDLAETAPEDSILLMATQDGESA